MLLFVVLLGDGIAVFANQYKDEHGGGGGGGGVVLQINPKGIVDQEQLTKHFMEPSPFD